jgi:hypothetical protein
MKITIIITFVLFISIACSAQTTDVRTFSSEPQLLKPTNQTIVADTTKFTVDPTFIKAPIQNNNKQNQIIINKSIGNEPKSIKGVVPEVKKK